MTASVAHLSFFLMPIVVPLLLFVVSDGKPFVRRAAAQALGAQLASYALLVLLPVLWVLTSVLVATQAERVREVDAPWIMLGAFSPVLVMGLMFVVGAALAIVGAVRAHAGVEWRVPLLGGLFAWASGTRRP